MQRVVIRSVHFAGGPSPLEDGPPAGVIAFTPFKDTGRQLECPIKT